MLRYIRIPALALATALAVGFGTVRPAYADGAASTRNIILGAAAVVAGIAIQSNVANKNAQANTVTGYLPNGDPAYADGHVALANGQTYYPGNYGQSLNCNGQGQCLIDGGPGYGGYR